VSTLQVSLLDHTVTFRIEDLECTVPVGPRALADDITSDPPSPEELINAIGWVQDHLEDVTRELPMAEFADRVEIGGVGVTTVADVEVGGEAALPFALAREAAEDVFRTLVTETAAARARNPGLPAAMVHPVLGTVSAIVAVMRFLHLDTIWLVAT
jgi:exopolyphosphatase/pppGpp-phosphohydrolase